MSPSRSSSNRWASWSPMLGRIAPQATSGLGWDWIAGITFSMLSVAGANATQGTCTTEWISTPGGGLPAIGDSSTSALSTDARFVSFTSSAANLVPGDTNGVVDVFVVDRLQGTIERASVGNGEVEGDGFSDASDISGDGRFVVFVSASKNWDPLDPHPGWDIYLRDRWMKTTELISVRITPPSSADDGANHPKITPDGRFIAFNEFGDNIVPGDVNGESDVFLRDRQSNTTELISVDSAGTQSDDQSANGVMSADGRYVAFVSEATNWFPGNLPQPFSRPYVYVRDRWMNTLTPVNLGPAGKLGPGAAGWDLDLSDDGRYLTFLYGVWSNFEVTPMSTSMIFVRDLAAGITEPIGYSVFGNSGTANPGFLAPANPSISADGRFVAFESYWDEHVLHSGNTLGLNVFVHDRLTGLIHAAGLGPNGQWPSLPPQSGAEAYKPSISPDGKSVSFICEDPTFGSGNAFYNVYLRTCDWPGPQVYCDSQANSAHCRPTISFSGTPSASAGAGFTVKVDGLLGSVRGLFFYSTQKALLTPFQGNYLCMEPPVRRMPVQNTGGGLPSTCSGSLVVDFNAWMGGGMDPSLVVGQNVCIQAWCRDGNSPFGSNLSNAVAFVVGQ